MAKRQLVGQAADIQEAIDAPAERTDVISKGDFDRGVLSTGSTLLDCAISSERVHGGGVPAGVIVEVYGPSSAGKTAILADLAASAKYKGGAARFDDPEARLDTVYARQCGLDLSAEEYARPNTVEDLFTGLNAWKPPTEGISVSCEDSIAAFSTEAEMADPEMQYAAAKRAQKYHQGFRTMGRHIAQNGWIIACSNHEMVSFDSGARTTPGGNALKYWASIRIRIAKAYQAGDIKKEWTITTPGKDGKDKKGAKVSRIIGIQSIARVVKNTTGVPFREAPIYIIFGHGIDDIRGNLQWLKTTLGAERYDCIDNEYAMLEPAIRHIEEYNLEAQLREKVIETWNRIDEHFRTPRKAKVRF
jgi:RecA/RadA recombinase